VAVRLLLPIEIRHGIGGDPEDVFDRIRPIAPLIARVVVWPMLRPPVIGQPVPRKEGRDKVTGEARYIDDLTFPGMLHGATVRSEIPRGRILRIEFAPDIDWEEFIIVTAADIPGKNAVSLILDDQPCLADQVINHAEEPVVLLAHADRYVLARARAAVRIIAEPLPAVLTLDESMAAREVIWGQDNIFKSYTVNKGDADAAWAAARYIVEGDYETGAQEQLYIENNGMIAAVNPDRGITVWGSMQCPYYVQKALMTIFALPPDKVRIIQTETGGGFGGKEEYPSMVAAHAALLARKSGRPVKVVYDRSEDMAATTKRHPSRTHHRTAVGDDGRLLAMDIDFAIDGGAYATLSSVVLSRGTIHAAGPYACPNVRIRSRAMATNTPPKGAFRGFGAPQAIFALERHMNRVARAVGLTPEEFRRRNFLHPGDATATGQVIRERIDLSALLDRALEVSSYAGKKQRFAQHNSANPAIKKGIGFATFMHGAGFTGSGEQHLKSVVGVEATPQGRVRILVASTEIGQGTQTVLSQIAAETLDLDYDDIEIAQPDTANVPNSGPTVASRTCMIVGKLVEAACMGLRQTLVQAGLLAGGHDPGAFRAACAAYTAQFGALRSFSQYEPAADIHWDDERYEGDAYSAYAWAAYVAEVSVDMTTYEIRVDDFVALQEVGRVIHPVLAQGQVEGGVAQAIGFATSERVVWNSGRVVNNQMTNYVIPTSMDLPPIRVFFEENPQSRGPAGAKGIGELPMDGPAPAVLNAVEDAIGCAVDHVPLLPEDLMEILHA
jgi:CO/xanthine dehydrogenase Mo-binding subunit